MTPSSGHSPPQRQAGAAASYTVGVSEASQQRRRADAGTGSLRLDPELRIALRRIARTQNLIIGCDYDGTLSPIVENPNEARPLPEAVTILRHLASLPETTVAIISGRALRDLAAMSRLPVEIELVGSHGAEFDLGSINGLTDEAAALLTRVTDQCVQITESRPGTLLESKPSGVAVHVRKASRPDAQAVLTELHARFDNDPVVHITTGKEVLELSVVKANKGTALAKLRTDHEATAAMFIGDDVTDEYVFEALDPQTDLSVKVGAGSTIASYRVRDPQEVLEILAVLGEEREAWLAGANAVPIEDHALLADGTDIALLTPDGSVNWLCHPGPRCTCDSCRTARRPGGRTPEHSPSSPWTSAEPELPR